MPSNEIMIAFFLATAVFAYMPGPSTLYAAAQTIARGRHAGWMAALGIHVGGYVHVAAAALGLAILFTTIPMLYIVLKFAGAIYLIWLGLKLFFLGRAAYEFQCRVRSQAASSRILGKHYSRSLETQYGDLLISLFYRSSVTRLLDCRSGRNFLSSVQS